MAVKKNLAIIGLGGAGLASLHHTVNELSQTLGPDDRVTINIFEETGRKTGGWTYRERGGDTVTTASHIDSMGFRTPDDMLRRMNEDPEEWQKYVIHREYNPDLPRPYDPEVKGSFPPDSTITYQGYKHYMDIVQKEIEAKCIIKGDQVTREENAGKTDKRITVNYIKGKAVTLEDVPEDSDSFHNMKRTMKKKTVTYIDLAIPTTPVKAESARPGDPRTKKPDTHAIKKEFPVEIDGAIVCLGNGMPDPQVVLGYKNNLGPEVFLNRFDDLDKELKPDEKPPLEGKENIVLIGAGNGSVAAIMKLEQMGYTGAILVDNINDDYPHRHLERGQKYWKREHFTTPEIKKLVEQKTREGEIKDGRVVDSNGNTDTNEARDRAKRIAEEVKNKLRQEFRDALKEANKQRALTGQTDEDKKPIIQPREYAMHGDTRNKPWSEEIDWRDVLDSLDRNAKTGILRDNWNSIMAALPNEVVAAVTQDRDGLTREFTGANWANSRHRTPVDHWKILDPLIANGRLQMRSDFESTQPVTQKGHDVVFHFKGRYHEIRDELAAIFQPPFDLIKAEASAPTAGGHVTVARVKELYRDALPDVDKTFRDLGDAPIAVDEVVRRLSASYPDDTAKLQEPLRELAEKAEDMDGGLTIVQAKDILRKVIPDIDKLFADVTDKIEVTPSEVMKTIQPRYPDHDSMLLKNVLVINTTGHTSKLALIDNGFAKLMQKPLRDGPAHIMADKVNGGVFVNRDSCPIRGDEKTVDPYVRYVGACTGHLGPWNKTIMVDIIRNADVAARSLLKTLDLDKVHEASSPAIDPSQGKVTRSQAQEHETGLAC